MRAGRASLLRPIPSSNKGAVMLQVWKGLLVRKLVATMKVHPEMGFFEVLVVTLQGMGWEEGSGLGARRQGMVEPVPLNLGQRRQGLGI